MYTDTTRFPLVWISHDRPGHDWEPQLDALLAQDERFVLASRHAEDSPDTSPAEKRRFAIWLKRNRARLKQRCAGAIVVVGQRSLVLTLKPLLQPLAKAFGFAVRIVQEDDVDKEAARLLAMP